ncbi:MAG: hypothetical protein AAF694_12740 [Bacteroidota bacterium]
MTQTLSIPHRFCGPPNSANGGFTCGMLAKELGGIAEVTLRKPTPMDKPLHIRQEGEMVALMDGEVLIATAKPGRIDFSAPENPGFEVAEAAMEAYIGFQDHPFPSCFVCGPQREKGDGLRIFAGEIPLTNIVASTWIPNASLANGEGKIDPTYMWCALDCPGSFSLIRQMTRVAVLGRMTAEIRESIAPEEKCVVIGWDKGKDGRKAFAGTALYNEAGELCAVAHAIWIEIPS